MKKSRIIKAILAVFVISSAAYAAKSFIASSDKPEKKITKNVTAKKDKLMNVGVINPTQTSSGNTTETTYLGEVLSEKNGKIYSYRSGIIDKFLVDVGSNVKEGQVVAKLLPAQFNPDLANMVVERKTMKIKALGMVKSAELTLKSAESRRLQIISATQLMIDGSKKSLESSLAIRSRVGESTQKQLDSTILEQEAKIQKMQANLDLLDTEISIQQKKIENMSIKAGAGVNLEDSKLKIAAGNIRSSINNAYNSLLRVFYGSSYNPSYNANNFNGRINLGAKDPKTINAFVANMISVTPRMKALDTLSQDEIFTLAKDMLTTVDAGFNVLDSSITTDEYSESMFNEDKTMLIMAKTDEMNGIQTNLNMYNEQLSMLVKETNMAGADISDEKLMLEKLNSERIVMEKDLAMAKAEKERMAAETQNMKTMAENEAIKMEAETNKMLSNDNASQQMGIVEADKMVTEAQKMLIDAKADLESANLGLSLFEGAGFSNEIKAPFSGKITKRYINVGESIGMTSPAFDIVQDGAQRKANIFVRFEIPESEYSKAKIGQEVSFIRTIEPLKKYSAIVKRVAPAINSASKGVIIEAVVEGDESEDILIGSSIRVSLSNPGDVQLTIPVKSIKQDENGEIYVFKVLKNTIQKQVIKTSRTYGDQVIVTEGLKIGTKVVIEDGGMKLEVGLPVTYTFIDAVKGEEASPDAFGAGEHAGHKM